MESELGIGGGSKPSYSKNQRDQSATRSGLRSRKKGTISQSDGSSATASMGPDSGVSDQDIDRYGSQREEEGRDSDNQESETEEEGGDNLISIILAVLAVGCCGGVLVWYFWFCNNGSSTTGGG